MADEYYPDGFWYAEVVDEGMKGLRSAVRHHAAAEPDEFSELARGCIKAKMYEFLTRVAC